MKNENAIQSKPEIHYVDETETFEKEGTETSLKFKKGKEKVKKDENFDEDQLIKLIKKNLKSKKKLEENCLNLTEDEKDEKIYNVTINNFIKPNINIVNNQSHVQEKKKQTKQRPQSAWKKEKDKINRTLS